MMRPNSVSVLPSHAAPQFKDKPLGGSGSPKSPGALFGRLTLRRVILTTGGLLFIYIVLSTAFGPGVGKDIAGYPVVKHKERNPYDETPNPVPDSSGRQPGSEEEDHIEHYRPHQVPPVQLEPADVMNKAVMEDTPTEGSDSETDQERVAGSGSGTGGAGPMVDDEGNVAPGTEPNEELESEEDKVVVAMHLARKASGVSYAQMLSSTRRERDYAIALIIREANLAVRSTDVYSVTNKNQTAPSNDIHDYLSLSKYYWPNKSTPSGLPYRRIDGHVNPEIETVRDYRLLRTMIREVHMMGMAYHFTGRKEYADKCAMRLKEWFLDEATYMNPNINYGSLRKGEKLGARTGVLDMFTIFRVFDALHYLQQEPSWPKDLIPRLQEWFTRYVKWLETSTLAKVERKGNNNHGTYFDVQIIAVYLFLGRVQDARDIARQALHVRIDQQVTAKGEQPEELERKTSWYYSVFNLQALMTLARWGDDLGVDMWFYEGPQGQSIKKAVDFMLPYALTDGAGWPVENLKGFDMTDYLKCLQIAWHIYGDDKYLHAIDVLEPKVQRDMDEGKIKTISTFMCDMSTLLEATTRGGQGLIWHWCLTPAHAKGKAFCSALTLPPQTRLRKYFDDQDYPVNNSQPLKQMVLDLDACIHSLYQRQLLAESVIKEICEKTKELLMSESNVVHIKAPVTVVGDIHGQFYDLLEIFKIGGYCPDTNYLFLGDYVDRGLYSVETMSILTCLKLRWPDRVQLVRGNHESRAVTQTYGFYTECMKKYGSAQVWHYFTDLFDYLTLSVVIDNMIFCVHGGLSPSIHTIDQIKVMDRFKEIPHEGPMADLVWSDPDPGREEFAVSPRGAGYTFGSLVVEKFLHENRMDHILRAHQLCMEGFQVLFDDQLSTVWSAPNYCYRCGNLASILEVGTEGERHFNVFEAAPENERPSPSEAQRALFSNGIPTGLFGNSVSTHAVSSNGGSGNGTNSLSYLASNNADPTQDTIHYFL